MLNGLGDNKLDATNLTSVASNLKPKRSNHQAKASAISYQKATVHYVSLDAKRRSDFAKNKNI